MILFPQSHKPFSQLQTYWLNPKRQAKSMASHISSIDDLDSESTGSNSESTDYCLNKSMRGLDTSITDEKIQRLIDWNVSI
jgi:hypothetical protein